MSLYHRPSALKRKSPAFTKKADAQNASAFSKTKEKRQSKTAACMAGKPPLRPGDTARFVGLLTRMFRRTIRQRRLFAFPAPDSASDPLSQKKSPLHTYSTAAQLFEKAVLPCSGFSPDSLVQQNKNACPVQRRGRAFATKAGAICCFQEFYPSAV